LITGILLACSGFLLAVSSGTAFANEPDNAVETLSPIIVEEKGDKRELVLKPDSTVIYTDDHEIIGEAKSVLDYLGALAIIDLRSITDLTPEEDSISMRGFSSTRFVSAIDGLTVQKTGGRKGSHIVDYALTPAFLIESVEILPGPHSALYDAKAIGGVINMVTRAPKKHASPMPDMTLTTSYSSFNTLNSNLSMQGSAGFLTYDVGYQKNSTDGYLRQSEADIQTIFTRLGLLLPMDGHVTVSGSYSTADRETPVTNDPTLPDYDPGYPDTEGSAFTPIQDPTWDKKAWAYRLNYLQNLPIGTVRFGAYLSMEDRERAYWNVDAGDPTQRTTYSSGLTTWRQHGGKVTDEYRWNENHATTIGFDMVQLYDGEEGHGDERVDKKGTFVQHQWGILKTLDLKLGLRYEDLQIHVSNNPASQIPNKGSWIVRKWDEVIPKSFLTWDMSSLSERFRDTSLSVGVSRIWHAPDAHGDYNPQGRPAGAWLDPEHGMGYDLVFMRRLAGDVNLKLNYSFYTIEDYIATNSNYAEYSGGSAGNLRYSDYKINLEEVYRHGVELELDGTLTRDLSFYLTHAWQKFDNQGDEPAGRTNLDDAPEHRFSCGLRYKLFAPTTLMLDYQYQTKEVMEVSDSDPVTDEIIGWRQVENPAYSLVNLGLKQTLFKNKGFMKDGRVSVYVKNVFDEVYYNSRGYPSTERTYGASFTFSI
jgi:iron complex outermembrane receptor protein